MGNCSYSESNIIEKHLNFNDLDSTLYGIKIYIKSHQYEKALELCENFQDKDNQTIQIKQVKLLLLMFEETLNKAFLDQALKLCEKNLGVFDFDIQRGKIGILLEKFFHEKINLDGVSSIPKIKFLIDEERLEEALELCNHAENQNNVIIQSQKVKALLLLSIKKHQKEFLNSALVICKKYAGNEVFDIQKERIEKMFLEYFNCDSEKESFYSTSNPNSDRNVEEDLIKSENQAEKKKFIEKKDISYEASMVSDIKIAEKKIEHKVNSCIGGTTFNRYHRPNVKKKNCNQVKHSKSFTTSQQFIKDIFTQEVLDI